MKSQCDFELRILRGVHAGARALLPDHNVVLGRDASCDFILSDDGVLSRHLQIQPGVEGFSLSWLKVSDATSVVSQLSPRDASSDLDSQTEADHFLSDGSRLPISQKLDAGITIAIGQALLAVQASNAPWPDEDALQALPVLVDPKVFASDLANDEEALNDSDASTEARRIESAATQKIEASKLAASLQLAPKSRGIAFFGSRSRIYLAAGVVASGLIVAQAVSLWIHRSKPALALKPTTALIVNQVAQQRSLVAISDIVKTAQLDSRVSVVLRADGSVLVKAVLLNDEEAEALAIALTRISPHPALEVSTEKDMVQYVQDALDRQMAQLAHTLSTTGEQKLGAVPAVMAVNLGGGLFRLDGHVADADQREKLMQSLQAQLPEPLKLESALITTSDLAEQMLAELKSSGLAEISGGWENGYLQIKARLAAADVPRWEQSLLRANKRFKLPFKVFQDLLLLSPVKQAALPFQLRGVVGGATPFVVLADGIKLMPGGVVQGWHLLSINSTNVIFEDAALRRVAIAR